RGHQRRRRSARRSSPGVDLSGDRRGRRGREHLPADPRRHVRPLRRIHRRDGAGGPAHRVPDHVGHERGGCDHGLRPRPQVRRGVLPHHGGALAAAAAPAHGDRAVLRPVRRAGDLPEPLPPCVPGHGSRLRRDHSALSDSPGAAIGPGVGDLVRCARHSRRHREPAVGADRRDLLAGERDPSLDRDSAADPGPGLVVPDPAPAPHGMSVFHLREFLDHLSLERGLSPRTLDAYGRDVGRLIAFLREQGVERPGAATAAHLREYVYTLKDRGLEPTSIRRNISSIRTYFAYLMAEGHVVADPSERLEPPGVWRRLPGVLSRAEGERLLEAPDPGDPLYWRDRALLEFAYASGVRVSELISLKIRDVSIEEGFATVFGKGSKERVVPIGRSAVRALDVYLREIRPTLERGGGKGVVFLNARGRPLTRMGVW